MSQLLSKDELVIVRLALKQALIHLRSETRLIKISYDYSMSKEDVKKLWLDIYYKGNNRVYTIYYGDQPRRYENIPKIVAENFTREQLNKFLNGSFHRY